MSTPMLGICYELDELLSSPHEVFNQICGIIIMRCLLPCIFEAPLNAYERLSLLSDEL